MSSQAPLFRAGVVAIFATLCTALPGLAQSSDGVEFNRTVGDGVFTEDQAVRGDTLNVVHCALCHSHDEWTSAGFLNKWVGSPVSFLYGVISSTMPPANPGQLTPDQYADIIAYLLKLNGAPAGQVPLSSEKAELDAILMGTSSTD